MEEPEEPALAPGHAGWFCDSSSFSKSLATLTLCEKVPLGLGLLQPRASVRSRESLGRSAGWQRRTGPIHEC